jgi:hypothetical protein
MEGYLIGFALGIGASVAAAWLVEYGARPLVVVSPPDVWGIRRQYPDPQAGFLQAAFFHVSVRNIRRRLALLGPRPAWSCQASLEVTAESGSLRILPIDGRWTAHPEPVAPATLGNASVLLLDPGKILAGRTLDVHAHQPQELCVGLKFEGEDDCFIFNNESYHFPRWKNPAWRLPRGTYRLRVTVAYEVGKSTAEFRLRNEGTSRDDVHLEAL